MFLRVIGLTQKPQIMIDILKILLRSENFEILTLKTNPSNLIQGIVIFLSKAMIIFIDLIITPRSIPLYPIY